MRTRRDLILAKFDLIEEISDLDYTICQLSNGLIGFESEEQDRLQREMETADAKLKTINWVLENREEF